MLMIEKMKIKYVWSNQNGNQSERQLQNSSKIMLNINNKGNTRDNEQHSRPLKKIKRFRSAFTTYQINYLEKEFQKLPYIGTVQRKVVAAALKIPERAVKIWFQNRRMKEKKEIYLKDPDDGKNGLSNAASTEEEIHVVNSIQSTTGTQIKILPLIVNNINDNHNINNNIQKLIPEDMKVHIKMDRTFKDHINLSKVIVTPTLNFSQDNQNYKILSSEETPCNSGRYIINSVNDNNVKQSNLQRKKHEVSSVNQIIENNGYKIPADLSMRRHQVFPQSVRCHQMNNSEENKGTPKKIKRFRSSFTTEQTNCLEREFKKVQYISNTQRKEIADALNISESAVKIWFQNRRMKNKKEYCGNIYQEHSSRKMWKLPNTRLTTSNTVQLINDKTTYFEPSNETNINNELNSNDDSKTNSQKINIKDTVNLEDDVHKFQTNDYSLLVQNSKELSNNMKLMNDFCENKDKIGIRQQKLSLTNDLHPKCHQDMPQDLSLKRQKPSQTENLKPELTHLTSNLCPNTYIQHNGILWQPINVVPMVATGSTLSLPIYNSSNVFTNEQNVQKGKCSCDCYVQMPHVPMVLQQNVTSPQFIITALPINKQ